MVRVPAVLLNQVINRGRVFMGWRSYRAKEFINIIRCYKCHGYGHFSKVCAAAEQLCEKCGKSGHIKKDCKEDEICVNCLKTRRKEYKHPVKSRTCAEYVRQVEVYYNRLDWT